HKRTNNQPSQWTTEGQFILRNPPALDCTALPREVEQASIVTLASNIRNTFGFPSLAPRFSQKYEGFPSWYVESYGQFVGGDVRTLLEHYILNVPLMALVHQEGMCGVDKRFPQLFLLNLVRSV